jgi:hypothetical protein
MTINLIAITLAIILGAIAVLHAYWAAGGLWPGRTERELIDTVIGNPHRTRMPPAWVSALVAAALGALALLALGLAPAFGKIYVSIRLLLFTANFFPIAGLVFLVRGVIGYLPFWRRLHPAEPFATNDLLIYSPLCLLLGAVLILLPPVLLIAITG